MTMTNQLRPRAIAIERAAGLLRLTWPDDHVSEYELRWVRAHCPCASCREERRTAALNPDPLRLHSGPVPSSEISAAELVGNYAIRLTWLDGHDTGIYTFASLRNSCPCQSCNPEGPPPFLAD